MDSSELQQSLSSSSSGGHLPPGATLGPYRIVRRIAIGGMGAVYEAEHLQLGRRVALKTMLYDSGGEDAQRFLNEARLVAALEHPHVVRVFDAGVAQAIRYLAMELIDGPTLAQRIEDDGPLDPDDAAELIRQVATGVHAAHLRGVLHRDLKPSNVLLDGSGNARLGDFGTARGPGDQRLTATGVVLGTPSYMAPEQALGEGELGAPMDVYGLGATLYHALTGQPPYEKGSQLATMQAVVSEPLIDPRQLRPELPPDLVAVCLKALARETADRYDSAYDLAEDLRRFLAGEATEARPLTPLGRATRALRRHALLALGACVVVLAFLILALISIRPLLQTRRLLDLQDAAAAWRDARLASFRSDLDRKPDAERLRAIRAALAWEALQADARAELGATDDARTEAIDRGLGRAEEYQAQADPLRARIAFSLATGDRALRELGEAAVRDPESGAGRAARLRLALRLERSDDARATELARAELRDLARGDDAAARRARLGLARAAACRTDWAAVRAALAGAGDFATEPERTARRRLAALAASLARPLGPQSGHWTLVPGDPPRVAVWGDAELKLFEARPEGLTEVGRARQLPGRLRAVRGVRGWGAAGLVALIQSPAGYQLYRITSRASGLRFEADPTLIKPHARIRSIAAGDYDGDGRTDLALVSYHQFDQSLIAFGHPTRCSVVWLDRSGGPRNYAFSSAVAADLDGDGRDDLILGPSVFYTALEVYRCAKGGRPMSRVSQIPCGKPTRMRKLRLATQKDALLVTVDYRGPETARVDDPERPWLGRDGVYVIEDRGPRPALVARWTLGPDAPPDYASRQLASRLCGWGLRLGEEPWLIRSYHDADGRPVWEVAPWTALGLENPKTVWRLPGADGAPEAEADLDGDGDPERVFEGRLHGLGEPPAARWSPPAGEPLRAPARLLRTARALRLLGDAEGAAALVARLQREHPSSAAAQSGALDPLDDLLWRGRRARDRAERRFRARQPSEGNEALGESERAFARVDELAQASAERGVAPGACWAKAAEARARLGRFEAAVRALDRCLAEQDVAVDARARLEGWRALLDRQAQLQPFDLPLPPRGVQRLGLLRPDGVKFIPGGLALRSTSGVQDGVVTRVELDPRPLRIAAHVKLGGDAWSARVLLGIAPAERVDHVTGIQLGLHDVATNTLNLTPVVGGRPVSKLRYDLRRFDVELHLQLDVVPLAGGTQEVVLRVRDVERRLLFQDRCVLACPAPVAGAHVFGAVSPRAGNRDDLNREQRFWRTLSWTTIRSVRVSALEPRSRAGELPLPWRAAAALEASAFQDAASAIDRALETAPPGTDARSGGQLAARWTRGLVASRQHQDERGATDLVAVARLDPHQAVLWFEDLAEEPDPRDRAAVQRALDLLLQDPDRLLQALARSLRGQLDAPVPRIERKHLRRWLAATHLELRNAYARPQVRWRQLSDYLALGRGHGARAPRSRFPRVIPRLASLTPDDLSQLLRLGRDRLADHARLQAAARLAAGRPEPFRQLAVLYQRASLFACAEQQIIKELAVTPPAQRAAGWLRIAHLRAAMGRLPGAVRALEEHLAAGGDRASLQPFRKRLGPEPRFQRLLRSR